MTRSPLKSGDEGASIVLLSLSLMLLIGASAVAVDIAGLWMERSIDQKITDSAASAGAIEAISVNGQDACQVALDYVEVNSEEITTLDDSGCATVFSATVCDAGTLSQSLSVPWDRGTIKLTYPVDDTDAFMTSGIIGAGTQPLHADDGLRCERFGVEMTASRDSLFAQLLGFNQGSTSVHSVAISELENIAPPINLLVLDRTECGTIRVEGNGGIIVKAVESFDDDGNSVGLAQGLAASDSDGSNCSSGGVIEIDGSGSLLQADGPEACGYGLGPPTYAVGPYTAERGCGAVVTVAPGTPGCNLPACQQGGGSPPNVPKPEPTALGSRITREAVDHFYNCRLDYTTLPAGIDWATERLIGDQSIGGCADGSSDDIYQLIAAVGDVPDGKPDLSSPLIDGTWDYWNADLGNPCSVTTPVAPHTGNVVFDCDPLDIKHHVRVNGDVVFDGDVSVTSSDGHLEVHNTLGDPGFAFMRGGLLTKGGTGSITFNYTALYMSEASSLTLAAGGGHLTWIAPDGGPFDDLALWSDSPVTHFWAGQATLVMEGVFFTPWATGDYSGSSGQNQTNAQWIADKIVARGNGRLEIQPSEGRGIPRLAPVTILIR